MTAIISKDSLTRILRYAAQLKPCDRRTILAALLGGGPPAIQCGARVPRRVALAAMHFAKRAVRIASTHEAIQRQMTYAESETLRNMERFYRQDAETPSETGEGLIEPLAAAEGGGVAADLVFDRARFGEDLMATLRSEGAETLQRAGSEFFEEIGRDDAFAMPSAKTREFLALRENLLSGIPDEIHAEIQEELQRGIDAGDSRDALARRITNRFAAIENARAETIASTETGAAYGFSRDTAMREAGITRKAWLTSHLDNVREAHSMAEDDEHNQAVPIDEPFLVGGEKLMFPGDPAGSPENVINCHCISLAVIDEEGGR